MISISAKVGKNCSNKAIDVGCIIDLLNARKKQSRYAAAMQQVEIPAANDVDVNTKLTKAIVQFQKNFQKMTVPDGVVTPDGNTILFLGGIRKSGKIILVDLDDQNLYAYDGTRLVHEFYCASGSHGHPTAIWPSVHRTFRKHREYRSKAYDAQMNYAMFFTVDGKAIHQSNAVGITSILKDWGVNQLGSHGCVRLSEDNARTLFDWAPMNTTVFIDLEKI